MRPLFIWVKTEVTAGARNQTTAASEYQPMPSLLCNSITVSKSPRSEILAGKIASDAKDGAEQ